MKSLFRDTFLDCSTVNLKRRPTTSLAAFDICLLSAWYAALRGNHEEGELRRLLLITIRCDGKLGSPQLVIFMHDFEQFDPAVVSNLFHICRSVYERDCKDSTNVNLVLKSRICPWCSSSH